jgi:hypothetical protein
MFSPHDDQNIPAAVEDTESDQDYLPNTQVYASGDVPYSVANKDSEENVSDFLTNFSKDFYDVMAENQIQTFDPDNRLEDDQAEDEEITPKKQRKLFGGASYYSDARAKSNDFGFTWFENNSIVSYKTTFPKHLGGTVFNKFLPKAGTLPEISKSYTFYDLIFASTNDANQEDSSDEFTDEPIEEALTVSDFLTESVSALSINSTADETSAYIKSTLTLDLLNLNRSEMGLKILQFMRKNVCVIRVSAGYKSEALEYYFEGMIEEIKITEALDKTVIKITAKDLLEKLFKDQKTLIVSQTRMDFPGMLFKDIIEFLHKYQIFYSDLDLRHNHHHHRICLSQDLCNAVNIY